MNTGGKILEQSGKETILVVDDDLNVLRALSITLNYFHYSVLQADSAAAAIRVWEKHGPEIDMLVTDMVMPGQTGLQLANILRQKKPDLRILLISGYSSELFCTNGENFRLPFLQKPFSPKLLAETVRGILDSVPELV